METLYTLAELQAQLKVSYRTLLRYIKDGRLRAVKVGATWRVTESNLKRFLNGEEQTM